MLALTYSFNAAFWERAALSLARQLQAKVTVVSDAAMAVIDPRAVRKAGVTYLDGRAAVEGGGAFHPKLFVIAGSTQAIVAVGSGNLTLSGWSGNAEIWTVLRGSADGAPSAFAAIADFLVDLPSVVAFSDGVDQALGRAASLLRGFPLTEPSPTVATSLRAPIVSRLPAGPVDSVTIASPFLDPASRGVETLVELLQPAEWEVILDRDANYDGASLVSLVEARGGGLGTVDSDRYHHGKVVEWVAGDERFALTGSPNASVSGMLRSAAEGGNVELALLDRIDTSLRPDTSTSIPLESYRATKYKGERRDEAGILLLGARIDENGLRLDLVRPLEQAVSLQVAETDIWQTTGELIPAGIKSIQLDLKLPSGTLLRLRLGDDQYSNIVPATHLELVQRPSIPSVGRVETNEGELFDDPKIAEQFALDLAELKTLLKPAGVTTAPDDQTTQGGEKTPSFQSWEEYLQHVTARLGDSMTRYGLALPRLGSTAEWTEATIDPDDPDERSDDTDKPERPIRSMRSAPEQFRRRYRNWAIRLVEQLPDLLPAAQLVGARLLLRSVAADVWDNREESHELLLKTASALGGAESDFPEEAPRLASMAALCLTVARRHISLETTGPSELKYSKAVSDCRRLVGLAADEFVSAYTAELLPRLGIEVEPARVLDVGHKLGNPLEQVVLDAEDLGFRVRRTGEVFHLLEPEPRPVDAALKVLARGQRLPRIGVSYQVDDQQVIVAWSKPHLAIEKQANDNTEGELMVLHHLEPSDLKRLDPPDVRSLRTASWASRDQRPDKAVDLFVTLGVSMS